MNDVTESNSVARCNIVASWNIVARCKIVARGSNVARCNIISCNNKDKDKDSFIGPQEFVVG